MKKILNKHNKISKIIALWLVFIMMATPLFSHSGLLSNPRAEGPAPTPSNPKIEFGDFNYLDTDFTVSGDEIYINKSATTGAVYYVPSYSNVRFDRDNVTVPAVNSEIMVGDKKYTITNFVIKAVVSADVASLQDSIAMSASATDVIDISAIGVDSTKKYIGIYARLQAKDSADNQINDGRYVKIYQCEIQEAAPFEGISASVLDKSGTAIESSKYYNEVKVKITSVKIAYLIQCVMEHGSNILKFLDMMNLFQ